MTTERTRLTRLRERGVDDHDALLDLLASQLVGILTKRLLSWVRLRHRAHGHAARTSAANGTPHVAVG